MFSVKASKLVDGGMGARTPTLYELTDVKILAYMEKNQRDRKEKTDIKYQISKNTGPKTGLNSVL